MLIGDETQLDPFGTGPVSFASLIAASCRYSVVYPDVLCIRLRQSVSMPRWGSDSDFFGGSENGKQRPRIEDIKGRGDK